MVEFVLWKAFLLLLVSCMAKDRFVSRSYSCVSAAFCKLSLWLGKDFTINMAQKQSFLCHKVYALTCREIEDLTYLATQVIRRAGAA